MLFSYFLFVGGMMGFCLLLFFPRACVHACVFQNNIFVKVKNFYIIRLSSTF